MNFLNYDRPLISVFDPSSRPVFDSSNSLTPPVNSRLTFSIFDPVEVIPLAPVGPVPPLPLSLQGKTALYGYEVTEELVKDCPDYLALKRDNYSGDARLRAFVEVAKRLGLDYPIMDIEPGEEWREVSSDPQASTAHIACFACTRYGIPYCVKEDVLRKLEQDLKTDVRAKWIVI